MITPFQPILDRARARSGGAAALEEALPQPKSDDELRAVPDDRYLSLMSRRVFRAGLKHALVDARWPAFEEVFFGFEPRRVTAMNDEDVEKLMGNRRLIRHWAKLKSVRHNAAAMTRVSEAHGSFGAYLAGWPATDITGLWTDLVRRFAHLGGNSGPSFLRMAGRDTFLFSGDVVRGLVGAGVVGARPTSKADLRKTQDAFNAWAEETGRPLSELSMILARSVD